MVKKGYWKWRKSRMKKKEYVNLRKNFRKLSMKKKAEKIM